MRAPPLHHLRTVAAVTIAATAAMIALQIACRRTGVYMGDLTRDAAAVAERPFYTGVVSNFGLGVWGAAIGAALVGWAAVRRDQRQREIARALLGFAGLSAVLALDDNLQVHEVLMPEVLGVSEKLVYLVYVAAAAAWALRFRRLLAARVALPLAVAILGFATSIGSDQLSDLFDTYDLFHRFVIPYVVEDGAKLVGVLNWAVTGGALAASAIADAVAARAADAPAVATADARRRSAG